MKKITRVWESRRGNHSFEYENIEIYDKEGRIRCRASLLDEDVWSPEMLGCGQGYADFVLDRMPGDETFRCFVGPVHRFDYRQEAGGTTTQIESWRTYPGGAECRIERSLNSRGQVTCELDGRVSREFEYDSSGRLIYERVFNYAGVMKMESAYGYRQEKIVSSGVPMKADVTDIQIKKADGSVTARTVTIAHTLSDELAWKREEEYTDGKMKELTITEYTYWGENFEYEWEESYEKMATPSSYGIRQYSKVREVED